MSNKDLQLNPSTTDYQQYPYPIGLDPVWQVRYQHNCIHLQGVEVGFARRQGYK
jgi:hypothetical protein